MDQNTLVQSLYAAIFRGTGTTPGHGGAAGQSFVSLEWPGLPADAGQFGNPWSPDNESGSAQALEDFSALVDQVPALSPVYAAAGTSVESVYGLALNAPVAQGGAVAKAFANAQEKFAAIVRGSLTNPMAQFHPSYPTPLAWCDSAHDDLWTATSIDSGTKPLDETPTALSHQVQVLLQKQPVSALWRIAPRPPVTVVTSGIRATTLNPAIQPPRMLNPSIAQSSTAAAAARAPDLNQPAALRLSPAMTSVTTLRAATSAVRSNSAASLAGRPASMAGVRPDIASRLRMTIPVSVVVPVGVKEKPATSNSLHISFQCIRVDVRRPWLDTTLFHLSGWTVDGVGDGAFSNGSLENNPGFFPLLPISFIAVKDVQITGQWSTDDKAAAGDATQPGNVSAFGPLVVSGGAGGSTFDGSRLTIPGVQILAWISTPVPFLPPAHA